MTGPAHPAAVRDAQDLRHHPAVAELLEHGDHPDPVTYRRHYTRVVWMLDNLSAQLDRARTVAADRDVDNGHLRAALTTLRDGNVRRLSDTPLEPALHATLRRARGRQPARLYPSDCTAATISELAALGLVDVHAEDDEGWSADGRIYAVLTAEGWLAQ